MSMRARLLTPALCLVCATALIQADTAQAQEPIGDWSTEEKATEGFPSGGGAFAHLVDVRVASHDAGDDHPPFDRIVLEFAGGDPAWRVRYVDAPVRADGSGDPIEIDGTSFLELRLFPASATETTGEEARRTYTGPTRIDIDGLAALELVQRGDFEGGLAWVVGASHRAPFAAAFLADPPRLVVDIVDRRDFGVARYQSDLNLWYRFVTPENRGRLVVDGRYDTETRAATSGFQRGQGLPVTGEADLRTRETLDGVLARLIATPPTERALEWPFRVPTWFWSWARWYLGHGEFAGDARNPGRRPSVAPARIPDWGWRRLGPFVNRTEVQRGVMLVRQRVDALYAPVEAITVSERSERDRFWMLVTGRHQGSQGNFAAWLHMVDSRWVPWVITRFADHETNLDPTGAPCDVKPAFAEPEC